MASGGQFAEPRIHFERALTNQLAGFEYAEQSQIVSTGFSDIGQVGQNRHTGSIDFARIHCAEVINRGQVRQGL